MTYILVRVDDTARLFRVATEGPKGERLHYIEGIADHFARANAAGGSWGDLFYVPNQSDGLVVACEVTESRSEFSDDEYTVAEVTIAPEGFDHSYRVAYRVDGV